MTSGDRPVTAVETMRASGVRPRAAVGAAGDGLQAGHALDGDAGTGAVVLVDDGAVLQRVRGDLALPEAVGDGLLREVLRAGGELVHVGAGDVLPDRDVLGGLEHRDVEVREVPGQARVVPVAGAGLHGGRGARGGLREQRVLGGADVGHAAAEARDSLDASRDVGVALAGLDGVEGHPGRLEGGGAVPVDRGPGQVVVAELHGDGAADVEARLTRGLAAAHHQVVDVVDVQAGDLVQGGLHGEGRQVVRSGADERALEGPTDRGTGGRDDDGLGHSCSFGG
jgi:hypothetical protein